MDEKYEEELKKSICQFYLDNRRECIAQYDMATSSQLSYIYEDITNETEINKMFVKTSVILLTANTFEKNVLHCNVLKHNEEKIKRIHIKFINDDYTTYAYYFKLGKHYVLHIESYKMGSYTIGGSADLVKYVYSNPFLLPTAIVSFGVCFGTKELDDELGSVYISNKIYPYFIEAKIKEKSYTVSDDNMFKINQFFYKKIETELLDTNVFAKYNFKVDFGNYITGEAVVSNRKVRDEFINSTTQDISCGDMEGYGLFKECNCTNNKVPCFILKSICDWATFKNFDSKKVFKSVCNSKTIVDDQEAETLKDRLQALSVYNAFNVLYELLDNNIFPESILEKLSKEINGEHFKNENIIHHKRISDLAKKFNNCMSITVQTINSLIDCLIDDNIITSRISNWRTERNSVFYIRRKYVKE